MAGPGRPTKCTPEITAIICDGIRMRMTHKLAAVRAGVGETTYYTWINWGREAQRLLDESGPDYVESEHNRLYRGFAEAVTRAVADGQAALLATIHAASHLDWRAAAMILERRHAEDFAKRLYRHEEGAGQTINVVFRRPDSSDAAPSDDLSPVPQGVVSDDIDEDDAGE